ncbi:MAG: DNA polymerase I [Caldilineaceae bacterium SB0668_bin_21]|nr:DNA polymerase I [Caldilineaceae bacterium SB0668_bin_21]MYC20113.1 DNA polymerase I [Caldilineaceae bacterium SB0662_bin_25]
MSTYLLIDGHSQAFRAFFGVKTPLVTSRGEPTTAVFGFFRKLFSVLREYRPDGVAVAFDKGDTFRHEEFVEYKATRDAMPDEMRPQMDRIEQVLEALKIPILTLENFEADDILGGLARQAAREGHDVLILSGDRDMFQLVADRVKVLYTSGGPSPTTLPFGVAEVAERYGGLDPDQFLEMKALVGDSSDNIPGVPGVGEKTAIRYLKKYGSLDELYAHIDEIRGPKSQQNLRAAEDDVWRNKRLMTIVCDVDVTFDAEAFRLQQYDGGAVRRIFEELDFRSLQRELDQLGEGGFLGNGEGRSIEADTETAQSTLFVDSETALASSGWRPSASATGEHTYRCIQTRNELDELCEELTEAEILSFDVETSGRDPMAADLVGLGIAWAKGKGCYIPVAHSDGEQLPWDNVREAVQPFFADATLPKVAHNGKYDLVVCRRHGLQVEGPIHDTMTIAWLLDPASRSIGLKSQAETELGWTMTEISELIGSGRNQISIAEVEIDRVTGYCGADVDATVHLWETLAPRLKEAGDRVWKLYEEIELPLLPVLADMEMAGIRLNTDFLADLSKRLVTRLHEIDLLLKGIVGHDFNLRSTQQLSNVMFNELAFPAKGLKKTKSGFVSTAAGELDKLKASTTELSAEQNQFLDLLFEQRQLEKLRGTYVDTLGGLVNSSTGRVHTNYSQAGAATGRLSSNGPNLQNIPIRTERGREIRKAFEAEEGCLLLAADYSQVELRILAHIAKEERLIEAFRQEQDIHAVTASLLFDVPLDQVNYDQRGLGKTINFATIYGVSAFGLSSRTDMDPTEAQQFLDQYFATYPNVRQYIDDTIRKAVEEGFVETLLGRRRIFLELQGNLPFNQRQALERQAINAPIQGTAADITKLAMSNLHKCLLDQDLKAKMLLQVHDELVLEVPHEELNVVAPLVRREMESAFELNVPLRVDVEAGPNWYDMEELPLQQALMQ